MLYFNSFFNDYSFFLVLNAAMSRSVSVYLEFSKLNFNFIEAAKEFKHYLPLRILCVTGLRVGEVIGIRWKSVDMVNKKIKVIEAVNSRTRDNKETKTLNSERTIKLDQETIDELYS